MGDWADEPCYEDGDLSYDPERAIDYIDTDGREWTTAEHYREACDEINRYRRVLFDIANDYTPDDETCDEGYAYVKDLAAKALGPKT